MVDQTTVAETCSCGASITVTSRWASDANIALAKWRTEHLHEPRRTSTHG